MRTYRLFTLAIVAFVLSTLADAKRGGGGRSSGGRSSSSRSRSSSSWGRSSGYYGGYGNRYGGYGGGGGIVIIAGPNGSYY